VKTTIHLGGVSNRIPDFRQILQSNPAVLLGQFNNFVGKLVVKVVQPVPFSLTVLFEEFLPLLADFDFLLDFSPLHEVTSPNFLFVSDYLNKLPV